MESKQPFFARFLEEQGRVRTGVRAGGGPPFHTLKYPSDNDEGDVTLKYPSDDDET
ncbi:MAG TPA: microviridin/marinostatin family tricyclic proteinase inhibitor [Thermoanaerobaculia bacterium]